MRYAIVKELHVQTVYLAKRPVFLAPCSFQPVLCLTELWLGTRGSHQILRKPALGKMSISHPKTPSSLKPAHTAVNGGVTRDGWNDSAVQVPKTYGSGMNHSSVWWPVQLSGRGQACFKPTFGTVLPFGPESVCKDSLKQKAKQPQLDQTKGNKTQDDAERDGGIAQAT